MGGEQQRILVAVAALAEEVVVGVVPPEVLDDESMQVGKGLIGAHEGAALRGGVVRRPDNEGERSIRKDPLARGRFGRAPPLAGKFDDLGGHDSSLSRPPHDGGIVTGVFPKGNQMVEIGRKSSFKQG